MESNKMKSTRYPVIPYTHFWGPLSATYPRGNVSFSAKVARISCNVCQIPPISRRYRDENNNTPKGKRWHISIHFPFPHVGFIYYNPWVLSPFPFKDGGLAMYNCIIPLLTPIFLLLLRFSRAWFFLVTTKNRARLGSNQTSPLWKANWKTIVFDPRPKTIDGNWRNFKLGSLSRVQRSWIAGALSLLILDFGTCLIKI